MGGVSKTAHRNSPRGVGWLYEAGPYLLEMPAVDCKADAGTALAKTEVCLQQDIKTLQLSQCALLTANWRTSVLAREHFLNSICPLVLATCNSELLHSCPDI